MSEGGCGCGCVRGMGVCGTKYDPIEPYRIESSRVDERKGLKCEEKQRREKKTTQCPNKNACDHNN